ncbi:hypothetical protein [Alteromonas gracilis]|uniref:hypothetical protein n=1 Tax=Alteromonas gracilis TaxID=1479524 RepID=UPI003734EA77
MTMPNTTLIFTFLKTRLEQENFPIVEIYWAVNDVSLLGELDSVSENDPLYPSIVSDRSYVSFYGDLSPEALKQWVTTSCIFRGDDFDKISESLAGGTVLSLALYNGAPQVLTHIRDGASYYEKTLIGTLAKYINGKYNALRALLADDIKLIYEAGLHNKPLESDDEVNQLVQEITRNLQQLKSPAA